MDKNVENALGGLLALQNEEWKKGVDLLTKYLDHVESYNLDIDQSIAIFYYNRGIGKKELNDMQGAVDDFSIAIKNSPDLLQAYEQRGLILLDHNVNELGLSDFKNCERLNPSNKGYYLHQQGVANWNLKNKLEAKRNFQLSAREGNEGSKQYLEQLNFDNGRSENSL